MPSLRVKKVSTSTWILKKQSPGKSLAYTIVVSSCKDKCFVIKFTPCGLAKQANYHSCPHFSSPICNLRQKGQLWKRKTMTLLFQYDVTIHSQSNYYILLKRILQNYKMTTKLDWVLLNDSYIWSWNFLSGVMRCFCCRLYPSCSDPGCS